MKTKYGIPQDQFDEIVARDAVCIYCHKRMLFPFDPENRADSVTIEHLNHRQDWYSVEDYLSNNLPVSRIVGLCCGACNSSRGSKPLREWFNGEYCQDKGINPTTVALVVRDYIDLYEAQ